MRILMISNLLPPDFDGGQEVNALKAAKGLRERGHEVDMVTSVYRTEYLGPREDPAWVHRITEFRLRPHQRQDQPLLNKLEAVSILIRHERGFFENYRRVRNWLKGRPKYDVAYIFGLGEIGPGVAFAPTELGIPVLYHCGDEYLGLHWANYTRSRLFKTVYRTALRDVYRIDMGADKRHFGVVSQFLANVVRDLGFPAKQFHVIPRGVEFPLGRDTDRERDLPFKFLVAARISKDKGIDVIVAAAAELFRRDPEREWRVVVVGKRIEDQQPGYYDSLLDAAQAEGIADRFELRPLVPREALLELYRRAGAHISGAVYGEPFANTIIETMASGTPLIVSDVGSVHEVVTDEVNGLIYPSRDPKALADRMERILTQPDLRSRLAQAALDRIDEAFTFDRIMDLTERTLNEVAEEPPLPV